MDKAYGKTQTHIYAQTPKQTENICHSNWTVAESNRGDQKFLHLFPALTVLSQTSLAGRTLGQAQRAAAHPSAESFCAADWSPHSASRRPCPWNCWAWGGWSGCRSARSPWGSTRPPAGGKRCGRCSWSRPGHSAGAPQTPAPSSAASGSGWGACSRRSCSRPCAGWSSGAPTWAVAAHWSRTACWENAECPRVWQQTNHSLCLTMIQSTGCPQRIWQHTHAPYTHTYTTTHQCTTHTHTHTHTHTYTTTHQCTTHTHTYTTTHKCTTIHTHTHTHTDTHTLPHNHAPHTHTHTLTLSHTNAPYTHTYTTTHPCTIQTHTHTHAHSLTLPHTHAPHTHTHTHARSSTFTPSTPHPCVSLSTDPSVTIATEYREPSSRAAIHSSKWSSTTAKSDALSTSDCKHSTSSLSQWTVPTRTNSNNKVCHLCSKIPPAECPVSRCCRQHTIIYAYFVSSKSRH